VEVSVKAAHVSAKDAQVVRLHPPTLGDKMDLKQFLDEMARRAESAIASRPDTDPEDLLYTIIGEEKVNTTQEINQDGQPMIFLCLLCKKGPAFIPGCVKKVCEGCKQEVWMSPATLLTYNKITNAYVLCVDCQMETLRREGLID
jgi:hypothetical protein